MKFALALISAAVLFTTAQAAPDYSGTQCQSWFKSNDRNRDGTLGTRENSTKFLSRVTLANDFAPSSCCKWPCE